jgi:hypothetical protein
VKPERVPHNEAEKRNEIRAARTRLTVAQQKGDADAEQEARSALAALHAKPYSGNQSPTVYMFARLPASIQSHVLEGMSADERKVYLPKAKAEVRRQINQRGQQQQPGAPLQ